MEVVMSRTLESAHWANGVQGHTPPIFFSPHRHRKIKTAAPPPSCSCLKPQTGTNTCTHSCRHRHWQTVTADYYNPPRRCSNFCLFPSSPLHPRPPPPPPIFCFPLANVNSHQSLFTRSDGAAELFLMFFFPLIFFSIRQIIKTW